MTVQVEHTDVAAYALGLLEDQDRRAFEAHLAACRACAAELADLGETVAALNGIEPAEEPGAPPAEVIELLRHRGAIERRRVLGTYLIGGVAAAAMLATGISVGAALASGDEAGGHDHSPAQAIVDSGERHRATDAGTGVAGLVALENKRWGTHVGLELRNVRGPLQCELVSVTRSGQRQVVTGWRVPPQGYGVPGSPDPLVTHGGTPTARADIARFEVRTSDGDTLLKIPV